MTGQPNAADAANLQELNNPVTPEVTPPEPPAADADAQTPIESLPSDIQAYIRSLRSEAERNRKAATTAAQQAATLQSQLEAGSLQTVEELQAALTQKNTELQQAQSQVTAFMEGVKASNERRIAAIPERFRTLVPPIEDPAVISSWLDANEGNFKTIALPGTDAGHQGPTPPAGKKLTAEQQAAAKALNVALTDAVKYVE